jgi:hypothetical protein
MNARMPLITAFLWLALVPPAFAAPCAGFTDVDDSSVFCPNVDWLKNRAITLGCTSATLYCPGAPVSRLSMAAFMNRLGKALTPVVLYKEAAGGPVDLDAPPTVVCDTAALPTATYPRTASASAILTAQLANPLANPAALGIKILQSTDNGVTWTPVNALPASAGGAKTWVNATVFKGGLPLAPATNYRYGLRIERAVGFGTGDLAAWNCQVKVFVTSQTGAAAPF